VTSFPAKPVTWILLLLTTSCSTLELDRGSLNTGLITGVGFELFGSVILIAGIYLPRGDVVCSVP
jgi:hypothetical protein